MTKEQAITRIKHNSMYIDDRETADYIIKALEQPTMDKAMNHILTKENDELKAEIGRLRQSLEQQPSDDCVSREQAKIDVIPNSLYTSEQVIALLDNLPSVTPTHCIATVRFSKEDLREICNERIEIACEHGTCRDCRHREGINFDDWFCAKHGNSARDDFYCADFEKLGDKNGN